MHNRQWTRIALIGLAAMATAACTTTASRVSTSYYTITGRTGAELDREISAKGPMEGHALASTAIRFVPVNVSYDKTGGQCQFKQATFRIEANITLPRWRQNAAGDDDLKTAWEFLERYARLHEQTHVAIAEKYAGKMSADLMAIPPQKTCDRLDKAGRTVIERIKREHNREQLAFDAAEQKRLHKVID